MNEETSIQIALAHSYLEIARAVFSRAPASGNDGMVAVDSTTRFGLLSVTVVFSYLALESFINYHFYRIWAHSKEAHEACKLAERSDPGVRIDPLYDKFFKKYGEVSLTELRPELKEKIKDVCDAYRIPQIYDSQPRLWQDFCDILKPTRDFVIHPVPEPELFQKNMQKLMEGTSVDKYAEVATDIMKFFYDQKGVPKPSWLNRNEVL